MHISLKKTSYILFISAILALIILSSTAIIFNEKLRENQHYLQQISLIDVSRNEMGTVLRKTLENQLVILSSRTKENFVAISAAIEKEKSFLQALDKLEILAGYDPRLPKTIKQIRSIYQQFLESDHALESNAGSTLIAKEQLKKLKEKINEEIITLQSSADNVAGNLSLTTARSSDTIEKYLKQKELLNTDEGKDKFKKVVEQLSMGYVLQAKDLSIKLQTNLAQLATQAHELSTESNSDSLESLKSNQIEQQIRLITKNIKQLKDLLKSEPRFVEVTLKMESDFNTISNQLIKSPGNMYELRNILNNKENTLQQSIVLLKNSMIDMSNEFSTLNTISLSVKKTLLQKEEQIAFLSRMVIFGVSASLSLLTLLIGYYLMNLFVNSLNELTRGIKKITLEKNEKFDFLFRHKKTYFFEFEMVINAFNFMLENLQSAYEKLTMLMNISVIANESKTVEDAIQKSLAEICKYTKWPVGHVYVVSKEDQDWLLPGKQWYLRDEKRFQRFVEITECAPLKKGSGLPGIVLQTGKPFWILDVNKHSNFPRNNAMIDLGVKSAFAFPITFDGSIVSVLELFSDKVISEDSRLLDIMSHVGKQLSPVYQRENAKQEILKINQSLELKIQERTQQLALRYTITRILLEQKTLDEAIHKIIENICNTIHFVEGEFWRSTQNSDELHCIYTWHIDDTDIQAFCEHSAKIKFLSGKGLPGIAYLKKESFWMEDIVHHPEFLRSELAQKAGLTSGFALPILLDEKVFGVLVFFSRSRHEFSDSVIDMFSDVGRQIGMFLERNQTQKRMEELSHQAGMSEVAASVLHNIGNVLNSVKVSLLSVHENTSLNEDFQQLLAATTLLKEHKDDLSHFLIEDEKGKILPGYLITIVDYLNQSNQETTNELNNLSKHIKHIEDIVAMQKSIGSVSRSTEKVFLLDLVETSLQMCQSALANRDIEVQKEYTVEPFVEVDASKVIQALVNLIQNAKDALSSKDCHAHLKKIRIHITMHASADKVDIAVSDNGIGIPPENLTKIFSMGYTTKPEGHGFGLHASALAADEMGGALRAESEGFGKGATFILTLPLS